MKKRKMSIAFSVFLYPVTTALDPTLSWVHPDRTYKNKKHGEIYSLVLLAHPSELLETSLTSFNITYMYASAEPGGLIHLTFYQ